MAIVAERSQVMTRLAFGRFCLCVHAVRKSVVQLMDILSGECFWFVVAQGAWREHAELFGRFQRRQIVSIVALRTEIVRVTRLALGIHDIQSSELLVLLLEVRRGM